MLIRLREEALQVLAKCSHIAYERLYIIRNYVKKNWSGVNQSGAQFIVGWEFDHVSLHLPGACVCSFHNPAVIGKHLAFCDSVASYARRMPCIRLRVVLPEATGSFLCLLSHDQSA